MLQAESVANARFDKVLAQEETWIRKGIEARRTRNEGRVQRLEQLRRERAERRDRLGQVSFAVGRGDRSGEMVVELTDVSKRFGDKHVISDFSAGSATERDLKSHISISCVNSSTTKRRSSTRSARALNTSKSPARANT
jgi:ATPase subunit of ABC transporter with duplicated ATPase domains